MHCIPSAYFIKNIYTKVCVCKTVPSSLSKVIANELCEFVMLVILAVSVSSFVLNEAVYVGVGLT